jgi:hypothetical protein
MRSKTTTSKKSMPKTARRKRGKKIYLNDVAWYYENDPADKRMTIEVVEMLKNIDFSGLLEGHKKVEEQPERGKSLME